MTININSNLKQPGITDTNKLLVKRNYDQAEMLYDFDNIPSLNQIQNDLNEIVKTYNT